MKNYEYRVWNGCRNKPEEGRDGWRNSNPSNSGKCDTIEEAKAEFDDAQDAGFIDVWDAGNDIEPVETIDLIDGKWSDEN